MSVWIDELIAKRVMGCLVYKDETGEWIDYPPAYSTDLNWSEKVKEKAIEKFGLIPCFEAFNVIVQTKIMDMPKAICLTALKLEGIDVNTIS